MSEGRYGRAAAACTLCIKSSEYRSYFIGYLNTRRTLEKAIILLIIYPSRVRAGGAALWARCRGAAATFYFKLNTWPIQTMQGEGAAVEAAMGALLQCLGAPEGCRVSMVVSCGVMSMLVSRHQQI